MYSKQRACYCNRFRYRHQNDDTYQCGQLTCRIGIDNNQPRDIRLRGIRSKAVSTKTTNRHRFNCLYLSVCTFVSISTVKRILGWHTTIVAMLQTRSTTRIQSWSFIVAES